MLESRKRCFTTLVYSLILIPTVEPNSSVCALVFPSQTPTCISNKCGILCSCACECCKATSDNCKFPALWLIAKSKTEIWLQFIRRTSKFIVSSSADGMVKVWDLASILSGSFGKNETGIPSMMRVTSGALVHSKDINTVAISPNDLLICTGSQDKTAKVYHDYGNSSWQIVTAARSTQLILNTYLLFCFQLGSWPFSFASGCFRLTVTCTYQSPLHQGWVILDISDAWGSRILRRRIFPVRFFGCQTWCWRWPLQGTGEEFGRPSSLQQIKPWLLPLETSQLSCGRYLMDHAFEHSKVTLKRYWRQSMSAMDCRYGATG